VAHLLVTGGAGYIGSHTVRALERAGHSVVVLDNLCAGRRELLGDTALVVGDVTDRDAVLNTFTKHGPFDGVLHFAALLSVPESVANPETYYHNNVTGSAILIEAARERGVGAFVLSSSAAVYGHPERQPISEATALAPNNPSGASNAMVERMLSDAESAHGLPWAALRYFNASGADPDGDLGECHDPETHLIPLALEAAATPGSDFALYGTDYATEDGTCVRDFVHVSDLARAHTLALDALLAGQAVGACNLGSGRGHSNREVLAAVERIVGKPVPVRECGRRPGDPPVLIADPTRFQRAHGWQPVHSDLDQIVETAWAWFRRWHQLS
jgi:UDP-glucose-4-epimerase GalE